MQEAATFPPVHNEERDAAPFFSDPFQSKLNVRLSTLCIAEGLLILVLVSIIAVMWYRGPIVVFMRQTEKGDEVISYNGRPVANESNTVYVGQDTISEGNRKFVARQFFDWLYGSADAGSRARNVQAALRLMVDTSAGKMMQCIKANGCPQLNLDLDTKRAESWQEQWTPQETTLDARDPFTVNLIGQYKVTKVINQQVYTEAKQLRLSVKLITDPEGRTDRNLQNGVRVFSYDYKELPQ